MTISSNQPPKSRKKFYEKLFKNLSIGILITLFSLGIGMLGYHHFENLPWIDSYLNAAMILSGMGPEDHINTYGGKLFAGTYAIFSGIIFLFVMAIIFAPIFKDFLHHFHMEEEKMK